MKEQSSKMLLEGNNGQPDVNKKASLRNIFMIKSKTIILPSSIICFVQVIAMAGIWFYRHIPLLTPLLRMIMISMN